MLRSSIRILSTISYRPVDLPERRLRRDTISSVQSVPLEPNGTCRRLATAPSVPTTSIHRTSSTSTVLFIIFFCSHIGITFRSRSLVVFFQLRSVSCAPFTPAFADGVVQRSLALYLPCFVSLCSPVWLRAISHRTLPIFTENQSSFVRYRHSST